MTLSTPQRDLSPLPLGEAGRRPGEGAFDDATKNTLIQASTLTPALSQREREEENQRSNQPSPRGRGRRKISGDASRELAEIVARLGRADARAFGLTWEECEQLLHQLVYKAHVEITAA